MNYPIEKIYPLKTKEILEKLINEFPVIAQNLIRNSQDLSIPQNQSFLKNFDDVREHEYNWHQWGILTHTNNFLKCFSVEVPLFLQKWGILNYVEKNFASQIDGIPKKELLWFAILFHDLGKFTNRKIKEDGSFSFKYHEDASGEIIREKSFYDMLHLQYGFTPQQIEYIARCAELHFKMGNVRTEAKKTKTGYTFSFVHSEKFRTKVEDLQKNYPDFAVEIGILFLADSLSKTELRFHADTDQEILNNKEKYIQICREKNFPDYFVSAVLQLPVSLEAVRLYLNILKEKD